jgi:hypothetical protein
MVRQAAILDRVIEPQRGGFSPEHAKYVLSLGISAEQQYRYAQLSEKAQSGQLSEPEQSELDDFLSVNSLLMILQSKARISLKQQLVAERLDPGESATCVPPGNKNRILQQ